MHASLSHQAVLLQEAIDALNIRADGSYIDGTFGRGGHSAAILSALGTKGCLLALDRDPEAERFARMYFQADQRFCFERDGFEHLAEVAESHGLLGQVQGILLDLGVSSPQLDDAARGFSFSREGPLDMRMNPDKGNSAAEWLASASEKEISRVLKEFGEERFHRRIARNVIKQRREVPIVTTTQFAQLVASAIPTREPGKHPATRSFQAVRIFINHELEALESVLNQSLKVLAPGGRLVAISFHSLEDRMVKRFMRTQSRGRELPPDLPVPAIECKPRLRVIGRAIRPGIAEAERNPRSRSAVMRVAECL